MEPEPTGSHVFGHAATSFISAGLTHAKPLDSNKEARAHPGASPFFLPVRRQQVTVTMMMVSGTQELHTVRAAMAVACVSSGFLFRGEYHEDMKVRARCSTAPSAPLSVRESAHTGECPRTNYCVFVFTSQWSAFRHTRTRPPLRVTPTQDSSLSGFIFITRARARAHTNIN